MTITRVQLLKLAGAASAGILLTIPLKALSSQWFATIARDSSSLVPQMSLFQAAILGMVQGLTEFIPISSTAHLKVVPVVLGWGDPGVAFTAVIQLGSIAAVLWYFWEDLRQVTLGAIAAFTQRNQQSQELQMVLGIGLGTLPIVFFGLLIKFFLPDYDNSPLRRIEAIAIASILMAILLGIAERMGNRKRNFNDLGMQDGILIGFAQAMALVPGVSRSGSTITAGLFMGLERGTAARFSFLLGIPAITLAGLVEFVGVLKDGVDGASLLPLIVGLISSAFFSYVAIAWLIRFLQTRSTLIFIYYRLGFGIFILGAIAIGLLANS